MPRTYEPIASQTLGTAASTVTFSSIPGTYTDLVLACTHIGTSGNIGNQIRFNSDSGTNYSNTQVRGVPEGPQSNRYSSQTLLFPHSGYTSGSNEQATVIWQLMGYANSNVFKTVLCSYARTAELTRTVGLWRSTNAVTSIEVFSLANTFAIGSQFSLYGIKAA